MSSKLLDSIIRIKNKKLGLVKLSNTKDVVDLLRVLRKLKVLEYNVESVEKFYININITKNSIKKTKNINTRNNIGWRELRELDKDIIMRTNRGLLTKEEGIHHRIGGIMILRIN